MCRRGGRWLGLGLYGRIGYDVDLGCGDYCVGLEIGDFVKCSSLSLGGAQWRKAATESEKGKTQCSGVDGHMVKQAGS